MTLHSPHTINSMTGTFVFQKTDIGPLPDFNVFFKHQASYTYYRDRVWSLTQLRRWGQITEAKPSSWYSETAKEISKPAIYRKAAEMLIFESKLDPNEIPAPDTTAIERQALSSLTGTSATRKTRLATPTASKSEAKTMRRSQSSRQRYRIGRGRAPCNCRLSCRSL